MDFKFILGSLVRPPLCLLTVALLGLLLIRHRRRFALWLVTTSLATLWLLATPAIGLGIYRVAERYPALKLDKPLHADAIVILGGGGARNESPTWGHAVVTDAAWDRIAYGATLARRSGLPVAVTGRELEARAMRNVLKEVFRIEPRWIDADAGDTWENARDIALMLHGSPVRRLVLVTHSCHMARAVTEFEAAGFEVVPAPVVVKPQSGYGLDAWLPRAEGLQYAEMGLHELVARPVSAALRRWRG